MRRWAKTAAVLVVLALPFFYFLWPKVRKPLSGLASPPTAEVLEAGEAAPRDPPSRAPSRPRLKATSHSRQQPTEIDGLVRVEPDFVARDTPASRQAFRAQLEETSKHYLEMTKFPPWSRPADGSMGSVSNLIDWNSRQTQKDVLVADSETRVLTEVSLDRGFASNGEPINAFVDLWREGADGRRLPVEDYDVRGEIRAFGRTSGEGHTSNPNGEVVASFAFDAVPATAKGAHGRRGSFVATSIPALRKQNLDVAAVVWVTTADVTKPFEFLFRYANSVPLRVLRKVAERVDGGSLAADFVVEVEKPGRYPLTAVLFDSSGTTPISTFNAPIQADRGGANIVTVTFFGRAMRERGIDGPYIIKNLHGHVEHDGVDLFWKEDREFTTSTYPATAFSDDEWTGDERLAKLRQYEQAAQELGRP